MVEYRSDRDTITADKRGGGARVTIWIVLIAIVLIVGVLFATGFWSMDVKDSGSLPRVNVSAVGGNLPHVDVKSKEVVVGTKKTTVDVPTVETRKTTIDVPTVGVKGN